jgi:pimeloyl-ACP methyl ester carboxylesterase
MKTLLKVLKCMSVSLLTILLIGVGYGWYKVKTFDTTTLPARYGQVDQQLFLGNGSRQPLLVGLGGSEGGNAWASDHWQGQREAFVKQGYAFLALGYFGMRDTPQKLDRISLDGIHDAILAAARNPQVDGRCIAVIGGSRGAELALTLASRYDDIKAVVAIVPSSTIFVGDTIVMKTSPFMYHDQPLPFVPLPWSAIPDLLRGHLRPAFEKMLANTAAVRAAAIPVERINGPVYLLSAKHDELWPSAEMSSAMIQRLQVHGFRRYYAHDAVDGGHGAPLEHFDRIEAFLGEHFLADSPAGCPRN